MILLGVFGMGVFVIIAAILNKLYALVPSLQGYQYTLWYFREASTAIYVANLPFMWNLLRDTFPAISTWARDQNSTQKGTVVTACTAGGLTPNHLSRHDDKTIRDSESIRLGSVLTGTTIANSGIPTSQHRASLSKTHEEKLELRCLRPSFTDDLNVLPTPFFHFPPTVPVTVQKPAR